MAKIVFFSIPASGHVNPSLPVIKALLERGEEILCINSEEFRAKFEATGANFLVYPDLPNIEQLASNQGGDFNIPRNMRDLLRVGAHIFPFVLEVLEREKPDLIIYDSLASWGKTAAKKLGLPTVSLISTFAIKTDAQPPLPFSLLMNVMIDLYKMMPSYLSDAFKFRRQYGLFPVRLDQAVMAFADLNIVFTSREFQPQSNKYDESFKFVGVSLAPRNDGSDFPFEALTAKPLIYISLGTVAQNETFIRTCFEVFGKHEGQFVLSAGKGTDIAALGEIPPNFLVRNFVPQLEILQRADAFITHGGMNSVQEGLVYGVPMVAVPQQIEQAFVAMELEKHGAGVGISLMPPYGNVQPEELEVALKQVLSSANYVENARKLGETLTSAGGYERAADEIITFGKRINP